MNKFREGGYQPTNDPKPSPPSAWMASVMEQSDTDEELKKRLDRLGVAYLRDLPPHMIQEQEETESRDEPTTDEEEVEWPVTWTDQGGFKGEVDQDGMIHVGVPEGLPCVGVDTNNEDRVLIRRALEVIDGIKPGIVSSTDEELVQAVASRLKASYFHSDAEEARRIIEKVRDHVRDEETGDEVKQKHYGTFGWNDKSEDDDRRQHEMWSQFAPDTELPPSPEEHDLPEEGNLSDDDRLIEYISVQLAQKNIQSYERPQIARRIIDKVKESWDDLNAQSKARQKAENRADEAERWNTRLTSQNEEQDLVIRKQIERAERAEASTEQLERAVDTLHREADDLSVLLTNANRRAEKAEQEVKELRKRVEELENKPSPSSNLSSGEGITWWRHPGNRNRYVTDYWGSPKEGDLFIPQSGSCEELDIPAVWSVSDVRLTERRILRPAKTYPKGGLCCPNAVDGIETGEYRPPKEGELYEAAGQSHYAPKDLSVAYSILEPINPIKSSRVGDKDD